jgi:hypothetical protein
LFYFGKEEVKGRRPRRKRREQCNLFLKGRRFKFKKQHKFFLNSFWRSSQKEEAKALKKRQNMIFFVLLKKNVGQNEKEGNT